MKTNRGYAELKFCNFTRPLIIFNPNKDMISLTILCNLTLKTRTNVVHPLTSVNTNFHHSTDDN